MDRLNIQLSGPKELEVDSTRTEHGSDDVVEFAVGKVHSEAVTGTLGERNVVLLHGGSGVAEQPVRVDS